VGRWNDGCLCGDGGMCGNNLCFILMHGMYVVTYDLMHYYFILNSEVENCSLDHGN